MNVYFPISLAEEPSPTFHILSARWRHYSTWELLSRSGVLNRGEISPMGEILGIQGGNESV